MIAGHYISLPLSQLTLNKRILRSSNRGMHMAEGELKQQYGNLTDGLPCTFDEFVIKRIVSSRFLRPII